MDDPITKSLDEIRQSTMVAKESEILDNTLNLKEDNIDDVEINDLLDKLNRKMLDCAKKLHFEEDQFDLCFLRFF